MENSGFQVIPQKAVKKSKSWSALLLVMLTMAGMVFCLQGMFQSNMSYLPSVAIVAVGSLFGFWTSRGTKNLLAGLAGLLFVMAAAAIALSDYLMAGAMDFLNQIIAQYNYITGQSADYFVVPDCGNMKTAYYVFLGYAVLLSACYISRLICGKHEILLFLCWLPILAGGLYLQLDFGGILAAWAAVSIVGAYACSQVGERQDGVYAWTLLVLLILLTGVGAFYYHAVAYKPSDRIAALKDSVSQTVEKSRYGQSDYPQGDLNKAVTSSQEERLKVTLSEEARVYLKGYTGSVLKNNKWSLLDPTSYSKEYEGMIKEYVQKGFHPLAQLSCYAQVSQQIADAALPVEEITVSVENVSAFGKYIYIPYGISFQDLSRFEGVSQDINVLSRGEEDTQTYQVQSAGQDALISYQGTDWLDEASSAEEVTKYQLTERDYRSFVEKHYCTISTSEKQEFEKILSEKQDSLSDITDAIRLALRQQGEEQKTWTSVNYAAEGVEMYRYYSVPARYVEGYLVQGEGEISVTGEDAHAWVEIYKDGIGWIPVDVTPGYYQDIPQQEKSAGSESTYKGQDSQQQQKEQTNSASKQKRDIPWMTVLLLLAAILAVLLLLFVFALILYRQWLWNKRIREMEQESAQEQIKALSGYLYDLSVYLDMDENDLPEEVRNIFGCLWYSIDPARELGEEETVLIKQFVKKLQTQIWQDSGFWKKQKLRYWKHLEYPVE